MYIFDVTQKRILRKSLPGTAPLVMALPHKILEFGSKQPRLYHLRQEFTS